MQRQSIFHVKQQPRKHLYAVSAKNITTIKKKLDFDSELHTNETKQSVVNKFVSSI